MPWQSAKWMQPDSMRCGSAQVVDVRSDAEAARGMIAGAKHIPPCQFAGAFRGITARPAGAGVLSDGRSFRAGGSVLLAARGFARVINLGRPQCLAGLRPELSRLARLLGRRRNFLGDDHEFRQRARCSWAQCPLPILRTKKSLTDMLSGQVLSACHRPWVDQGFSGVCQADRP
jgi:hypothetical protein